MDTVLKNELMKGLEWTNQLVVLFNQQKTNPQLYKESLMASSVIQQCSIILNTFETAISILQDQRSKLSSNKNDDCNLINPDTHFKHPTSHENGRTSRKQDMMVIIESITPDDEYHWRKYGQKAIVNAEHPREYYKCGNYREGCPARKYVQMMSQIPTKYKINYYGHHTCNKVITINDYASQNHMKCGINQEINVETTLVPHFPSAPSCEGFLAHVIPHFLSTPSDEGFITQVNTHVSSGTSSQEYLTLVNTHVPNSSSYHESFVSNSYDQCVQDQLLSQQCYLVEDLILTDEDPEYMMSDGVDFVHDLGEVKDFGNIDFGEFFNI